MTDSQPVDLWVRNVEQRTNQQYRPASDAEVIARLRQVEGVEEVAATRGLVQYKWRCGNCGTDHGEARCDDPDLYDHTLYRIKPELEPGSYLVVPDPDSRKGEVR